MIWTVEILGIFIWAHNRFQKFLEISKPMYVSPCDMQSKLLAAQRQGVEAKFSPTSKVRRDVDQHIRWGVAPLGKWVRREVPHARSSSSSSSSLVSSRLDSTRQDMTRHDTTHHDARRGLPVRVLDRKTERLTESLTDTSQLAGSGCSPRSWVAVTDSDVRRGRGPCY
jgi:hypothetical protein